MKKIFVTGMMRSGTSLLQILLTNHPQMFVVYQPYYLFYLAVRKLFLEKKNLNCFLALGDNLDCPENEQELFTSWLLNYQFSSEDKSKIKDFILAGNTELERDFYYSLSFKGDLFSELQDELWIELANLYNQDLDKIIGIKEIFCEGFLKCFSLLNIRSIFIIRDPRAVIASARSGRYLKLIGDRYPILLLIRLWRKTAAFYLANLNNANVFLLTYEGLTKNNEKVLGEITSWLGIAPYPEDFHDKVLLDNDGKPWKGNSSYSDISGVKGGVDTWRKILSLEEIRFIEACTWPELQKLGYEFNSDLTARDIEGFKEDERSVRPSYLEKYKCDNIHLEEEVYRFNKAQEGDFSNPAGKRLFLMPSVF